MTEMINAASQYGADPTWPQKGWKDSADAIQKAIEENPGGVVYLAPGKYYCSKEIVIDKNISLIANAVGRSFKQSVTLVFPNGSRGIVIKDNAQTGGAQETKIENIILWMLYKNTALPSPPVVLADGIFSECNIEVINCRITGFRRHGIYIKAGVPETRANLWQIRNCQIDTCGLDIPDDGVNKGDGVRIEGGDANGGICEGVSCTANKGWGIKDDSGLGNTYIACHVRTNSEGGYCIGAGGPGLSGVNASLLIGCYCEADNYNCRLGDQTLWIGGTNAALIKGGQFFLAGNARMRFQSGGGLTPPLSVMGHRDLTGPVFALLNWAGAHQLAASQDGSVALGLAPGEALPKDYKLSIWTYIANQVAIRLGVTQAGYIGPVGEILGGADGNGYGAGYMLFRTIGAGGKPKDTLKLKDGRVSIGPAGLELPLLSKKERGLLKGVRPGTMVYGTEENGVMVFDGQQWKKLKWED